MGKIKKPQINSSSFSMSRDTWRKIQRKLTMMVGMDYRSLALFRVTMALCVIGDVIERATDLRVMYSEYGIMPRHLIVSRFSSNYFVPIHLVNTSVYFQAFLFALHIVFALCMLVGYRTKLFSIITWFMTISLQAYVGVVGHGGDVFFRMMLFLNIFIPTANYFAIDTATFFNDPPSRRPSLSNQNQNNNITAINLSDPDPSLLSPPQQQQQQSDQQQSLLQNDQLQQLQIQQQQPPPLSPLQIQQQQQQQQQQQEDGQPLLHSNGDETGIEINIINSEQKNNQSMRDPDSYRFLSFGTFAILLQMGLMYCTSYFHKTGVEWKNGEATFYAITLDYFATDFARFLLNFRTPLRLLTIAVAKWELVGIMFLVSPIYTDWCRLFGAFGFIAMHAGFVMCLRLGLFFFVTAGAQLINIPTPAWELFFKWTDKKILKGQRATRVYYNTTSPISQKIALILKTFFIIPGHAVFAPLEQMITQEESINVSPSTTAAYSLSGSSSNDHSASENDDDGDDENDELERSHGRRRTSTTPHQKNGNHSINMSLHHHQQHQNHNQIFGKKDLVGDDWLVTIDANGIRKRNIYALNYICSKSILLLPIAMACSYVPIKVCNIFSNLCQFIHSRSQQKQIMSGGKRTPYQKRKYPTPTTPRIYGIINNIWMLFICYFLFAYNMNVFKLDFGYDYSWNQFAYILRLDQGWNMFSPAPPKTHWWHVMHGELDDGTKVELFKDEGMFKFEINTVVNFEKPDPFYKSYGNHRWFKYYENGYNQGNSDALRLEHGKYVCREFNSRHSGDEMLYKFSVYFVHEFQNLDGTVGEKSHSSLWNHICYNKEEQ
ncbi:hypothetical protein RB653_001872 [Dictyostelium firmibasis]|uniref:HTTM-like domain-containing protein n=1 Tax=Dictyostelium firmibasis TaxID=79012 RepID=A0AAN7YYC4_9MYCE